jgi:hypothetical protein
MPPPATMTRLSAICPVPVPKRLNFISFCKRPGQARRVVDGLCEIA